MTIVEHLKSDSDVFKLIATSLGGVLVCVLILWLLAVRCSRWRKTAQGKRKQLQRPFVTKRISLTPRNDLPTFRYGPFNHWSQDKSSPSPQKSVLQIPPSPTSHDNTFLKRSTPTNYQKTPEKQVSPRFLGQIISCINKSSPESPVNSPKRSSAAQSLRTINDYKNPFILDQSTTDYQESTLPSLVLSSDSSTDCIMQKSTSDMLELQPDTEIIKVDKAVNTDITPENNNITEINKPIVSKDKENRVWRKHKKSKLALWSHKCNFPCRSHTRQSYAFAWSYESSSSSTGDPLSDIDEQYEQGHQQHLHKSDSLGKGKTAIMKRYTGNQFHTRKYAADVCVQTELSGELQNIYSLKQDISPLCSSDSTLKETAESSAKCCCRPDHRNTNQKKPPNKLQKFPVVNNLASSEYAEDSELLESGLSISDRTSFIPAKSWYSLGSLCDEDENCKICGRYLNYHAAQSDGSDTKLNLSALDAVSYNDTGYTSTEEESISNSEPDSAKHTASSCEHHSSPENGSYDGDYESDDEIFHCRLVASDDMVYKPLPSISEPFAIQAYAEREWTSQTPKANAIRQAFYHAVRYLLFLLAAGSTKKKAGTTKRKSLKRKTEKGYAAISDHISCQQLRQIRGDNYCAIRATLFQALVNGIPVLERFPTDDTCEILRKLIASTQGALHEWSFAGRIEVGKRNVMSVLQEILGFFVEKVSKCEELNTKQAKTDYLLSLFNEETEDSDFKLLEAVKVVMLYHAVQMYEDMNKGNDVPVLTWLLFARDSSNDPRDLLRNHLNHVGDSGGLEQVEMCLLGYALGVVIQVFRPSQVNKPDFIANYPYLEDVPPLTPTVSLVAEDDRHYNILVD